MIKIWNVLKGNETKELKSAMDGYKVSWTRVEGEFSSDKHRTVRFFINKEEANEFANQLRSAHKMLGNSGYLTDVEVEKEAFGGL